MPSPRRPPNLRRTIARPTFLLPTEADAATTNSSSAAAARVGRRTGRVVRRDARREGLRRTVSAPPRPDELLLSSAGTRDDGGTSGGGRASTPRRGGGGGTAAVAAADKKRGVGKSPAKSPRRPGADAASQHDSAQQPPPPPRRHRVIIIGAGISGLAAARELMERRYDVLVLEARTRPGGRLRTVPMRLDGRRGDGDEDDDGQKRMVTRGRESGRKRAREEEEEENLLRAAGGEVPHPLSQRYDSSLFASAAAASGYSDGSGDAETKRRPLLVPVDLGGAFIHGIGNKESSSASASAPNPVYALTSRMGLTTAAMSGCALMDADGVRVGSDLDGTVQEKFDEVLGRSMEVCGRVGELERGEGAGGGAEEQKEGAVEKQEVGAGRPTRRRKVDGTKEVSAMRQRSVSVSLPDGTKVTPGTDFGTVFRSLANTSGSSSVAAEGGATAAVVDGDFRRASSAKSVSTGASNNVGDAVDVDSVMDPDEEEKEEGPGNPYPDQSLSSHLFAWHTQNLEMSCGAPFSHLGLKWNDDEQWGYGGDHCVVKEGFGKVVEELGRDVDIRYGVEVTGVRVVPPEGVDDINTDGLDLEDDGINGEPERLGVPDALDKPNELSDRPNEEAQEVKVEENTTAEGRAGLSSNENIDAKTERKEEDSDLVSTDTGEQNTATAITTPAATKQQQSTARGRKSVGSNKRSSLLPGVQTPSPARRGLRSSGSTNRRSARANKGQFDTRLVPTFQPDNPRSPRRSNAIGRRSSQVGRGPVGGPKSLQQSTAGSSASRTKAMVGKGLHAGMLNPSEPHSTVEIATTVGGKAVILQADHVICTLPLGVLQVPPHKPGHVTFSPPLPKWKRTAIRRVGFGRYNKLCLVFPYRFWDATNGGENWGDDFFGVAGSLGLGGSVLAMDLGLAHETGSGSGAASKDARTSSSNPSNGGTNFARRSKSIARRTIADNGDDKRNTRSGLGRSPSKGTNGRIGTGSTKKNTSTNADGDKNAYSGDTPLPILLLIFGGQFAADVEEMTDSAVVNEAMEVLRRAWGKEKEKSKSEIGIPNPIDYAVTRWGHDRYARGSFSYIPRGIDGFEDLGKIGEPVYDPYIGKEKKKKKKKLKGGIKVTGAAAGTVDEAKPHPPRPLIQFAGEHTTPFHPSTIHGAYASGIREAYRLDCALEPDLNVGIQFDRSCVYGRTFSVRKVAKATGLLDFGDGAKSPGPSAKRRNGESPPKLRSASKVAANNGKPAMERRSKRITALWNDGIQVVSARDENGSRLRTASRHFGRDGKKNNEESQSASKVIRNRRLVEDPLKLAEDIAVLRGTDVHGRDFHGFSSLRDQMLPVPEVVLESRRGESDAADNRHSTRKKRRKDVGSLMRRYGELVAEGADLGVQNAEQQETTWEIRGGSSGGDSSWLVPASPTSNSTTATKFEWDLAEAKEADLFHSDSAELGRDKETADCSSGGDLGGVTRRSARRVAPRVVVDL